MIRWLIHIHAVRLRELESFHLKKTWLREIILLFLNTWKRKYVEEAENLFLGVLTEQDATETIYIKNSDSC